ncbi:hypothetical protein Poly24_00800 [Rosistilla carotiformis]|uniref:Carboxypeptidase regulatory-like domain-containing protein n=1 Tax=Rosistilla carotiformis TaxID=2528017 RepID=A0A518JLG4_9BACT|nr:carboxypeptidase-like regulatory domain-containing protein [Rosistilla carotiformis]QDV66395.1 hypothetical protein Poly24_00800 [Rosistilla carotiformis]
MFSGRIVLLCLIAGALSLGCSRAHNLPGETGTVKGHVSYRDGTIPEGSSVVMLHKGTGIPAVGVTDSDGNFTMIMREGPDVLVGDYVVNIRPPGEIDDNVLEITAETVPPLWNEVPQKYWNPSTSNEAYTVNSGTNFYEFTLTDN